VPLHHLLFSSFRLTRVNFWFLFTNNDQLRIKNLNIFVGVHKLLKFLQFIRITFLTPVLKKTKRWYKITFNMDGWIVSGGVARLHASHKTGLMCTTVLSLLSQSLIFVFVLGSRKKQFLCCMYLVEEVWSYRKIL
jgi:hypothetical protein